MDVCAYSVPSLQKAAAACDSLPACSVVALPGFGLGAKALEMVVQRTVLAANYTSGAVVSGAKEAHQREDPSLGT